VIPTSLFPALVISSVLSFLCFLAWLFYEHSLLLNLSSGSFYSGIAVPFSRVLSAVFCFFGSSGFIRGQWVSVFFDDARFARPPALRDRRFRAVSARNPPLLSCCRRADRMFLRHILVLNSKAQQLFRPRHRPPHAYAARVPSFPFESDPARRFRA